MNESGFRSLWDSEKPIYRAWGKYVVDFISRNLEDAGENLNVFLKVPAKYRLKEDGSLIDKAFYRPGKIYSDPYYEIEDKVGVRFVVLLLEDIKRICSVVEGIDTWDHDPCKHFDEDKEKEPLLFTYQSVHYILRPKLDMEYDGIHIPKSTPCEVQIRTLLQHAHAELTHDAIYKSKTIVRPKVHRTVAKCMALIETTDDFFVDVTKMLNRGPLQEHSILERLDGIYTNIIGVKPHNQKSSLVIWDVFEQFIDDKLVDEILVFLENNQHIPEIINNRYLENTLYQQSTVLFVYWLLKKKKDATST